jgi:cystathionine beta-synthase
LEVKTIKDIVNGRKKMPLITIDSNATVADAVELMKKYDIENIPVMEKNNITGSVSEGGLFQKLFSEPRIKEEAVNKILEKPYPVVAFDTPVERIGSLITKEIGAVLAQDETGSYHIVTKYDIIQSMAK